jgi:hypothetical protein
MTPKRLRATTATAEEPRQRVTIGASGAAVGTGSAGHASASHAQRGSSPATLPLVAVAPLGAVLGGALVLGIARSSWAPWGVAAAAVAATVRLLAVPTARGARTDDLRPNVVRLLEAAAELGRRS